MAQLRGYRQLMARLLGGYEDRGALSTSGDRTASATGSAAALIEARWPILRQRIASDAYEGALLYRTGENAFPALVAADRVRQIGPEGYVPGEGRYTPDTDWANPPVAGEHYELHTHGFDPFSQMTTLINDALRAIMLVVDVNFTPAVDAKGAYVPAVDVDGHALAGWLTQPKQLLGMRLSAFPGPLYVINGSGGRADLRGRAWSDGARLYLAPVGASLGTATPVWARVFKPAYDHCRNGSSAAYGTQAGLTAGVEDDEAQPSALWVAAGAVGLAWERNWAGQDATGPRLQAEIVTAAKLAYAREQALYYQSVDLDASFAPLERVG